MPKRKSAQSERSFRTNRVLPFFGALVHTSVFPIQQASIKGDADYILCAQGRFIWLELKRSGEKPSALQAFKADWVKSTGGVVLVADPDNWEETKTLLLELDRRNYSWSR